MGLEHCLIMASKIESGMWIYFDQEISKGYGRKFRQLQTSFRNDGNAELRLRLLMGEVDLLKVT